MSLEFALDRHILIRARRETVFRYFTDSARFAAWWGSGSSIEATPGGRVSICNPNGVRAAGEVVSIRPPGQISFTYGYESGKPIPSGSSLVTITLTEEPAGTRLHLHHEFDSAAVRDEHVQGWRYELAVFSSVVCDEVQADVTHRVDDWFAAWSEPDVGRREALLSRCVAAGVRFRDRYSLVEGLEDLRPHLAAVHVFMPGARVHRSGPVRHCQGTALADWIAPRPDGGELGRGTNVFSFDADGRVEEVVGLWNPPSS